VRAESITGTIQDLWKAGEKELRSLTRASQGPTVVHVCSQHGRGTVLEHLGALRRFPIVDVAF